MGSRRRHLARRPPCEGPCLARRVRGRLDFEGMALDALTFGSALVRAEFTEEERAFLLGQCTCHGEMPCVVHESDDAFLE